MMLQKIQKQAVREQIVKTVVRSGNGGAVWVPKSWLGEEVVIVRPEKPRLGLKERIMKMLEPHLKDIVSAGIYGSYARNEQTKDSDIDVLVITSGRAMPMQAKTHANGGKVETAVFQIDKLRAAIEKYPAIYYQMVQEAVPL
ncbi:nucleotidyltransferase domain-containing protein, partial [Candidatus Woesearchaeota archaeon]|nr:nucleotidyltransferase domain-containing protein [Candidatus Woesearchaeota archaeon]